MKLRFSLCLLCFILCRFSAIGQSFPNLRFNQLTVKDGLSTNAVKCTYEDQNGIIWIATSKGLNRYDGTGIKEFRHNDTDNTSISSDVVVSIVADHEQQLWLGTLNGLCRFNPRTGKAVNFFHDAKQGNSLASNWNCMPFVDSKGRLWLAMEGAIQLFNYQKNKFTTYLLPKVEGIQNAFRQVREDNLHRLWAIGSTGLYLIDEKQQKLVPGGTQKGNDNLCFFQARNGTVYIGQAKNGLKSFDLQRRDYQAILTDFSKLVDVNIYDIIEWTDNEQRSWLCMAAEGGLVLKDSKSNHFREYVSDVLNPSSLNAFNIYHINKDRQNRLWLSTDNGISILDPNLQNFENIPLYQQLKLNNPKLFGLPNNMLETSDKFYVTGYYAKGVYVFDKNWQFQSHILQVPANSKSKLSKSINSIYKDEQNNLWFSTDSGLVKQTGARYTLYFPQVDLSIKDNLAVSKVYKRKDGLFWIRARQNGLYLFNPIKGIFVKQYKPDHKNIDGVVYSSLMDKQGDFWIGATKGISRYIPSKDAFSKIVVKGIDGKVCDISWVTDLTEDNAQTIWAVSDVGLVKIDKAKGTGLLIDNKSGLPENYLKRILIDSLGNLWIPSQQGIIRYDRKKTFTFFNINNGLPFQYEGHGFFEIDQSNNFLLSYSGFVTRFNPYHIKTNLSVPKVIFMDVSADGTAITPERQGIVLKAGTKIINIHFAITNYTAPQENKYFYKVGKKAHWQEVKNGDIALGSPRNGKYELYIKGSNNDEVFSLEERLLITVLPYWYETNWFAAVCILLIGVLIFFLWRRRIAFIRGQFLFKQRLSESELKAIRSQMNPHFIFNVLNSIESYIMDNDKKVASRLIQKFAALSRLILENSTKSLVTADREWKAIKLYTELEAMRYDHAFSYTFMVNEELEIKEFLLPPMLIQPLIENAILHGLIESPKADAHLEVALNLETDHICITVTDNGVGYQKNTKSLLPKGIKEKSIGIKSILERVEMINRQHNNFKASFDIRLSENERGTIATICLPIIKVE
jgi:ligand-binding sensor domain-containing protein